MITNLMLAIAVAFLAGTEPRGFQVWSAAQLKEAQSQLAAKLDADKFAGQGLGTYPKGSFMLAHREGNGKAELHETQDDVYLVQSGEATLVIGGSVVDPKTIAPHEIRGASIHGGQLKSLGYGDVVYIPAGTPHQLMVATGKQFTYFVVKIDEK